MLTDKQKDDMQKIIEALAKLECPQDKSDLRFLEVRPILPMDLGLDSWLWTGDKVELKPRWHIVLYGIHSRYLLQVMFRTSGPWGNIVAAVSTGQLLYEPYLWKKQEARWVTWLPMEKLRGLDRRTVPFSILGYVIEPAGMYIA